MRRKAWAHSCCLFTVALCLALSAQQAFAFKIIEPAEGAKLTAGKTVTTNVDLGKIQVSSKSATIGMANRMTPW